MDMGLYRALRKGCCNHTAGYRAVCFQYSNLAVRNKNIFMLFPGLPYSIKNYLLAMSGLSFLEYVIIGWVAQFSLSIPFILLGRAVIKMAPLFLGIALALVLLGFVGQNFLRRRYKKPY